MAQLYDFALFSQLELHNNTLDTGKIILRNIWLPNKAFSWELNFTMNIDKHSVSPKNLQEQLASLPPEWPIDLLPVIQSHVAASRRKVVVLDDDPTGTQTVHGIPVLTTWSVDALLSELRSAHPAFYILTNSRSLPLEEAQALNRQIGTNLRQAAVQCGVDIEVISRSDSTLRGHFPGEVDALASALGLEKHPYLIVPFFLEGGRYTIENVHYVAEGEQLIPAARTAYAQDIVFGYSNSNLQAWVEEKTIGRIPAGRVNAIHIDTLRRKGPEAVERILSSLEKGSACVVNAASYRDLEVFVLGLLSAEEAGGCFLMRTAASVVRVRAGITPRPLLDREELAAASNHGGLFLVGSYVPKTTAQVSALQESTGITSLEVDVRWLLDDARQAQEINRAAKSAARLIERGEDVLLFTSRELIAGNDPGRSLDVGRRISASLVAIMQRITITPRYLVAKGGITASDIATQALDVRRAMILGQILPGVPVWQLGDESRFPGMPYIVFPGNVGGTDSLLHLYNIFTQNSRD
jgi:uncharacterized protein YgbK (DUF1537 family)